MLKVNLLIVKTIQTTINSQVIKCKGLDMAKVIDLTGQKFNKLTVINRAENDKHGQARWNCECDCGNTTVVRARDLKTGNIASCGCNPRFIDLSGHRFGKLTVINRAENSKSGMVRWHCQCECGNTKIVQAGHLKSGSTTNCGWNCNPHGMSNRREYSIWEGMKKRCTNPNDKNYRRYGGRGITVCTRWLESFENFYADMGDLPADDYTLDRINNDLGYSPENCRWATWKEQANNRGSNRLITHEGKTRTLAEWSEIVDINRATLWDRLSNLGWTVEEALTTPARNRRPV